jgi:FkbM family methyltransferase
VTGNLLYYMRRPARIVHKLQWRWLYHGRRRDVTVDSYNGRLTFDSRDKYIGKYLYVDREYERDILELVASVLRRDGWLAPGRGRLMADVGANIGMISIAMLQHGWFERAVAFEPSPDTHRLLLHNIAQNGLAERITPFACALSDAPGELEYEIAPTNSGDNRVRATGELGASTGLYGEERRPAIRVPVETFDRQMAAAGVAPAQLGLLWIDIQGHEAHCLAGARAMLAGGAPVVTEFWPYGLARAGTTRASYMRVVTSLFTHAHRIRKDRTEKLPIARVDDLFTELARPNDVSQLLFVRE